MSTISCLNCGGLTRHVSGCNWCNVCGGHSHLVRVENFESAMKLDIIHAADCKAARILGLKREA